jgi:putative addiction module component (TIGR02574 family)
MAVETLLQEILALPEIERIELIGRVWDSLPESPAQFPLSEARKAELDRRTEEMRSNPESVLDYDDAMLDLRNNP